MDRYDLRAQKDNCGIGLGDEYDLAANRMFNVTHWPYVHNSNTYECVQEFFEDSLINLAAGASSGAQVITKFVALASMVAYSVI